MERPLEKALSMERQSDPAEPMFPDILAKMTGKWELSWTLQTRLATSWIPLADLHQQHIEKDNPVEHCLNSWPTKSWKKR